MERNTRSALGLAALIGGAGITHFVSPRFYDPIVPHWMPGAARTTTYASGAIELGCAVLIANPRTRRLGALLAFLTFLGVYPANIQSALDGGIQGASPPMNSAWVAWARLPLQFPLFIWSWRIYKDSRNR